MAKPSKNALNLPVKDRTKGPVECLGQTFESEDARRAHFAQLLRAKLADPAFRETPGFPRGSDEDILRMSDPPYYTACPNPFLPEFVRLYGKAYVPGDSYHRDPLAVDTSVGKSDPVYNAHAYHTKVPHLAIVPSILHYTEPGDIVLDGFCGSGMTGVAAQFCATAPAAYRAEVEADWRKSGLGKPKWGARRAILNDLGPAATFIAANLNLPFDVGAFERETLRILGSVERELGWMYETTHRDGTKGSIKFTVWSEVFTCGECSGEVVFAEEALDRDDSKVRQKFPCPHCHAILTKDNNLERVFDTSIDPATGGTWRHVRLRPVLVNYAIGSKSFEKAPDSSDLALIARVEELPLPAGMPTNAFPIAEMYHGSRLAPKGFTNVHHLYFSRARHILASFWRHANETPAKDLRLALRFWIESHLVNLSIQNRYRPEVSFPYNPLTGVYYVSSLVSEASPFVAYRNKAARIAGAFREHHPATSNAIVSTATAAHLGMPADSVDYVFTDPPFGSNIFYADLNYLVEAWHGVITDARDEAIVDIPKHKGLHEYQELMHACFAEYARVLKPGRWMTVVFSNSSNAVWRAIQEALGRAGFVVADVRTLDKQQGSYRQVTSSAMKQDLVISAYKPSEALTRRFELASGTAEDAWAFVREHLRNVPIFADAGDDIEVVAERTPQTLHDRMIAFFVQRGVAVPLSSAEFFAGLDENRFAKRDGMYFLADQVGVYDRKRALGGHVRQLPLFVQDEASAIRWVRQILDHKPMPFEELNLAYMPARASWAKHERDVELRDILRENFLHYDGEGPVPAPIHSYLSSNLKLRNLDKSNPDLRIAAKNRWYVPSVHSQADIDKLRTRALLKEFEEYKQSTQRKIKQFRTEAVRAGFKAAYDARDYRTIVEVAAKLPDQVVQEDDKLVMYLDVALTRYESAENPKLL